MQTNETYSVYDDIRYDDNNVNDGTSQIHPTQNICPSKDASTQNERLLNKTLQLENDRLQKQLTALKEQNNQLKINISRLFITAKMELKHKDQEIQELRDQVKQMSSSYKKVDFQEWKSRSHSPTQQQQHSSQQLSNFYDQHQSYSPQVSQPGPISPYSILLKQQHAQQQ